MVKDIIIDDNADLSIVDGDFEVNDSDSQHIILLINTALGSWKQSPTCGVGISQYSGSTGQGATLKRNIDVQLDADGYKINEILLQQDTGGTFQYSVSAERL